MLLLPFLIEHWQQLQHMTKVYLPREKNIGIRLAGNFMSFFHNLSTQRSYNIQSSFIIIWFNKTWYCIQQNIEWDKTQNNIWTHKRCLISQHHWQATVFYCIWRDMICFISNSAIFAGLFLTIHPYILWSSFISRDKDKIKTWKIITPSIYL